MFFVFKETRGPRLLEKYHYYPLLLVKFIVPDLGSITPTASHGTFALIEDLCLYNISISYKRVNIALIYIYESYE